MLPAGSRDLSSASNFPRTPLDSDMVFSDGYASQMATISGDTSALRASLTIAV